MGRNSTRRGLNPNRRETDTPAIRRYGAAVGALLGLCSFGSYASAQGINGTDVIIQLRLAGDVEALPPINLASPTGYPGCRTSRLLLHRPMARGSSLTS